MKTLIKLMAAALLAVTAGLQAAPTIDHKVNSFSINTGLIFELYNVAQQNNGTVTSWPAGMNSAVVQASVVNNGDTGKLSFQVVVKEPGSACSGENVVWSPTLITKAEVPAGATVALTASDFDLAQGSGGGSFCTSLKEELEKQFKDLNPDSIKKAVDMFLKRRFQICLVPVYNGYDGSGVAANSGSACTTFTLFQSNPGAQAQVGVLVYPHNNAVPDCNINFLWTPALYPGLGASEVAYTLELREGMEGEPLARVDVPAGQTYYQWSGRDRALVPGQKYYWRIISRKASTGEPFGGPDGRGWNIQKWFVCGESQAEAKCRYTLEDLDRWVKANAQPDVREALKGFMIKAINSGQLDDPAVCRLLSGKARLGSVSVTKK